MTFIVKPQSKSSRPETDSCSEPVTRLNRSDKVRFFFLFPVLKFLNFLVVEDLSGVSIHRLESQKWSPSFFFLHISLCLSLATLRSMKKLIFLSNPVCPCPQFELRGLSLWGKV